MSSRFVFAALLVPPLAGGLKLRSSLNEAARGSFGSLVAIESHPAVPGAGIDEFTPYEEVLKDGFMKVECIKDDMYLHADKFGDNRAAYSDVANVSIVHYAAHVPKLKRKQMTINVCFEFCRTVPKMGFFGITNGRECYCTPYGKAAASDSSDCDAPCDGDKSQMCGGKTKSSIFEMHWCDSTEADLKEISSASLTVTKDLDTRVTKATDLSDSMQKAAAANQKIFGKAGDPAASDLMQEAKVFAGELLKAAQGTDSKAKDLGKLVQESMSLKKFTNPATVTRAQHIMHDMEKLRTECVQSSAALGDVIALAAPGANHKGAAQQYYPIMYFVDKKYKDTMQTCSGTPIDKPIVGESVDGCASACDDAMTCVGFSYFGTGEDALCFLFSSLKSAAYYTGCDKDKKSEVRCLAKLTEFQGIDLTPDKSGKCNICLKKLTKADRCY